MPYWGNKDTLQKIIASTNPNHNLPLISNIEQCLQMIRDKEEIKKATDFATKVNVNHLRTVDLYNGYYASLLDNKAEYTKKQVIDAIKFAMAEIITNNVTSKEDTINKILQSLTPSIQPTNVEIEEVKITCDCNKYSGEPEFICNCEPLIKYKITKIK